MLLVLLLFTLICCPIEIEGIVDCSLGSRSCDNCMIAYPHCFWCGSNSITNGKCLNYFGAESLFETCQYGWPFYDNKKCERNTLKKDDLSEKSVNQLLDLLSEYKNQKNNYNDYNNERNYENRKQNQLDEYDKEISNEEDASSDELKQLLHKLLLLKLLKKWKNEGSDALSEKDKKLILDYTKSSANNIAPPVFAPTTSTTTRKRHEDVNKELKRILTLLKKDKGASTINDLETENVEINTKSHKTTATPKSTIVHKTTQLKLVANHHEAVGSIEYEEQKEESLSNFIENTKHIQTTLTPNSTTTKLTTSNNISNTTVSRTSKLKLSVTKDSEGCDIFEEPDNCNNDGNCTWCNTQDLCISRKNDQYKYCAKVQKSDEDFTLDKCLDYKHCGLCVEDSKCYWCGTSKSCHSYPFIGYVPQGCGGDWYVKQCDVQLAVIVIVLPLIIILLAMITFYFCLKYCYYRKKLLRVPLFERPGVFDYRKDKKVYFVNPEDEDTEDEMQVENLRKKYRLPAEKAPLIDPNS